MCGEHQFGSKVHLFGLDGALGRTCAGGARCSSKKSVSRLSCLVAVLGFGIGSSLHGEAGAGRVWFDNGEADGKMRTEAACKALGRAWGAFIAFFSPFPAHSLCLPVTACLPSSPWVSFS